MSQRFYSEEEAEAILKTASMKSGNGISKDQLLEMAAELGLSREEIESAELKLQNQSTKRMLQREFDKYIKRKFWEHLTAYLIVSSFLVILDLITSGMMFGEQTGPPNILGDLVQLLSHHWAYFPILGWGVGLAFSFVESFNRQSVSHEKAYRKWLKKRNRSFLDSDGVSTKLA